MIILDNIFEPEDLREELTAYVEDSAVLGQVLRHPLVYQVPYSPAMNRLSNLMFAQKSRELVAAIADENWHKFVFLHERPYRLEALEKVMNDVEEPGVFWPLAASVWIDSENIADNFHRWRTIWANGPTRRVAKCMSRQERVALRGMPTNITVYRGVGHRGAVEGLSWTIDPERAIWFAKRFADACRTPILAEGSIQQDKVLAYFTGRGESEIVAFPEDVKIESIKRL